MKKIRNALSVFTSIVVLLVTIAGCSMQDTDISPRESVEKFVGSDYLHGIFYIGHREFNDLVLSSGNIVVGTVESVAEVRSIANNETFFGDSYDYVETLYNIEIEQTWLGENGETRETLKICFVNPPDVDYGTTKPQIGERFVFFLGFQSPNEENVFTTQGFERGMFRIGNDNTMFSFHTDEMTAQFDGMDFDLFKEEVLSILKNGEFSEEYKEIFTDEFFARFYENIELHREYHG
ncbi:MAG: hypothetical protein FWF76_01240 [Oscillospiraceae bacterium]|nr:hypothetical protein [Oscillospiraceae bacterium]